MSHFTEEKIFFVLITERNGNNFIQDYGCRRRYMLSLERAAKSLGARIKSFEYQSRTAYITMHAKRRDDVIELMYIANRTYCTFLKMKEKERYVSREFDRIFPVELKSVQEEEMIGRGILFSARY